MFHAYISYLFSQSSGGRAPAGGVHRCRWIFPLQESHAHSVWIDLSIPVAFIQVQSCSCDGDVLEVVSLEGDTLHLVVVDGLGWGTAASNKASSMQAGLDPVTIFCLCEITGNGSGTGYRLLRHCAFTHAQPKPWLPKLVQHISSSEADGAGPRCLRSAAACLHEL